MNQQHQPIDDILKTLDIALTGILQQANPRDVPQIAEKLCEALVELNNNLILDKKEKHE
jgi:hypothetical protein